MTAPTSEPATTLRREVVGGLMARNVTHVEWDDPTEAFPAFLVIVGIPFTWSIADGIAFGFITRPLLKLLAGRGHEVTPFAYALGVLFVLRHALL